MRRWRRKSLQESKIQITPLCTFFLFFYFLQQTIWHGCKFSRLTRRAGGASCCSQRGPDSAAQSRLKHPSPAAHHGGRRFLKLPEQPGMPKLYQLPDERLSGKYLQHVWNWLALAAVFFSLSFRFCAAHLISDSSALWGQNE